MHRLAHVFVALRRLACGTLLVLSATSAHADHPPRADYEYLDNGLIRLGISETWGGAIGFLGESSSPGKNYVNRHDAGRLIQKSYFGPPFSDDGVFPNWPWNPVQGGDGYENTTGVLEITNDGVTIYAKCQPMDWAGNNRRTNAIFETWYTLEGRAVRIETRFTNPDEDHAQWRDQELLAVYVVTELSTLKYYDGAAPFVGHPLTSVHPGFPNEYYGPSEYWAAYVDENGFGLGAFSQDALYHTAFRVGRQGSADDFGNETNYFAIIPRFTVPPNAVRTEVSYVVLDDLENIRAFAESKAVYPSSTSWTFDEAENREGWSGDLETIDAGVRNGSWSVRTPHRDSIILGPNFQVPANGFDQVEIRMSSTNASSQGRLRWTRLTDEIFAFQPNSYTFFDVIPDGEPHTYTVDLSDHPEWKGRVTQLRAAPVTEGDGGAVSIESIRILRSDACPPTPRPGCVPAGTARLEIVEKEEGKERLKVRLDKLASPVHPRDFGTPVNGPTTYAVCVYDQANALVGLAKVNQPSAQCGTKPCWREISGQGFRYRDRHGTEDGIQRIVAKAGDAGRGSIQVAGENDAARSRAALPNGWTPALAGNSQATVQVLTSDAGCFEATVPDVLQANRNVFKGKLRAVR